MKRVHVSLLLAVAVAAPTWAMGRVEEAGRAVNTTYRATLVNVEPKNVAELPGDVVIEESVLTWTSTGDWKGTFVGLVTAVLYGNGASTATAFFTFQGTVLGVPGTLMVHHRSMFKADGSFFAHNTILSGTGALASLRGEGQNVVVAPGVIEGHIPVRFARARSSRERHN